MSSAVQFENEKQSVAIIGAGLSGLTAALELLNLGFDVEIFERDNRVGGKVCTHTVYDNAYDLGAIFLSPMHGSYPNIRNYANSLKIPNEFRLGGAFDLNTGKALEIPPDAIAAPAKITKILENLEDEIGYHQIIPKFQKEVGEYNLAPFLASNKVPFNLSYWYSGYGYSHDSSLPAIGYLKYMSLMGLSLTSNLGAGRVQFRNGFGEVPQKLAEQIIQKGGKIHLNANILKIHRGKYLFKNEVEIILQKNSSTPSLPPWSRFDHLIITAPSAEMCGILDNPSPSELTLMNSIQYIGFCSFLVEFNKVFWSTAYNFFVYTNEGTAPLDHYNVMIPTIPTVPVAIFYVYKSENTNLDQLMKILEQDIKQKYGSDIEIVKLHAQYDWKYMPHYKEHQIKEGYYERFDSIQGLNSTYYSGSLFNFECTEATVQFSKNLVARFFAGSQYTHKMSNMSLKTASNASQLSLVPVQRQLSHQESMEEDGFHLRRYLSLFNMDADLQLSIEEVDFDEEDEPFVFSNSGSPLKSPSSNRFTASISNIPYIHKTISDLSTFLHSLHSWKNKTPDQCALQWYDKGKKSRGITYKELWNAIEHYGFEISKLTKRGELVVLLFEPGIEFYIHFYACLRIGVIAVPCYPPMGASPQKGIDVITKILNSSGCKTIIMSDNLQKLKFWRGKWPVTLSTGETIQYHTIKTFAFVKKQLNDIPFPKVDDIAFLQYTSGSTGDPKGVIIGHKNFQYNLASTIYNAGEGKKPIFTSWLPQYHDMGLALATSSILFIGGTVHLMSPLDFLVDPLVWFDVISLSKSTHSIAPNFAYGLVTRKWDSNRARKWNLSELVALGNSAEPVLLLTIEKFKEKMMKDVPSFDCDNAILPGYGMAECVACVGNATYGTPLITGKLDNGSTLVASMPYVHRFGGVAIVSANTNSDGGNEGRTIVPQGVEGEIWLSNDSVARGYWNNAELTEKTFKNILPEYDDEDGSLSVVNAESRTYWLATGDLGFIVDDHLFISGRSKDLIIINGKNYYPQDIEAFVHEFDSNNGITENQQDAEEGKMTTSSKKGGKKAKVESMIRPGCVACFAANNNSFRDTEGFVLVCEIRDSFLQNLLASSKKKRKETSGGSDNKLAILEDLGRVLFDAVSKEFNNGLIQIMFIKEKTLPKTTSGKLKRTFTKECWLNDKLSMIAQYPSNGVFQNQRNVTQVITWIVPTIQEILIQYNDIPFELIKEVCVSILLQFSIYEKDVNLASQGIDSLKLSELYYEIKKFHQRCQENHYFIVDEGVSSIENLNLLFEWTGKDLIKYLITGHSPVSMEHGMIGTHPSNNSNAFIRRKDCSGSVFLLSSLTEKNAAFPKLFLIHNLMGFASFRTVIDRLSEKYLVYGINSPNLMVKEDQMIFYDSFELLANDYLLKIQEIVSKGERYYLGGHSAGGYIALEICYQLQLQNETVDSLFLFDTFNPFQKDIPPSKYLYNILLSTRIQQMNKQEMKHQIITNSYYLYDLMCQHTLKKLFRVIPNLYFIKCKGELSYLLNRGKGNDGKLNWEFNDYFLGLPRCFHSNQKMFVAEIFCGHLFLFDSPQKVAMNQILKDLLKLSSSSASSSSSSDVQVTPKKEPLNSSSAEGTTSSLVMTFSSNKKDMKENLFQAVQHNSIYWTDLFLSQDFDDHSTTRALWLINVQDHQGKSLLHHAVELNYIDLANYLIQKGINLQLIDQHQFTAMDYIKHNNMKLLLSKNSLRFFGGKPTLTPPLSLSSDDSKTSDEARVAVTLFPEENGKEQDEKQQQIDLPREKTTNATKSTSTSLFRSIFKRTNTFDNISTSSFDNNSGYESVPNTPSKQRFEENHDFQKNYSNPHEEEKKFIAIGIKESSNHSLNGSRLLGVASEVLTKDFIKNSLFLLFEKIPSNLMHQVFFITYRLLLIRLLSTVSIDILAASILDDVIFNFFLVFVTQLQFPLLHYFTAALDNKSEFSTTTSSMNKKKKEEESSGSNMVVNVFHAGWFVSFLVTCIPWIGYCCIAKQFGNGVGLDTEVTHQWSELAFTHIIGILPSIMNITLEYLFVVLYHREVLPYAMFIEGSVGLVTALLFHVYSSPAIDGLNGYGLGIALSLGAWIRLCFYLKTLSLMNIISIPYAPLMSFVSALFRNGRTITLMMRQILTDLNWNCFSSLFVFSNTLTVAILFSSRQNEGIYYLIGFIIGYSTFRILSMIGQAFATQSAFTACIMKLGLAMHQISNAFGFQLVSLVCSLLLTGLMAIPLYIVSGKQLTEFFIEVDNILPVGIDENSFYHEVRVSSNYFIGIALLNAASLLIQQYLLFNFSFHKIQWISFLCYFVFGNIILITTFLMIDNVESSTIIAELFGINGLALLFYLFVWLKECDFDCLLEKVGSQCMGEKSFSAFYDLIHK